MIPPHKKMAIYMEGALGLDIGKMGYGVLRYSPNPVVAVIDSQFEGRYSAEVIETGRNVPVVRSVEDAANLGAEVLVLGTAPPGGLIPSEWIEPITHAVKRGLSICNGLHEPLAPRFPNLRPDQHVWDIRKEPAGLSPATGKAMQLCNRRILTVGMDMAVGKMTAGLELLKSARQAGINAEFVATGQIGITITGTGVALDAVRVDYATGAVETEVLKFADAEWVIIEGQGSLGHPGSSATLPLLRGSMPTDLVLCCRAGQTHLKRLPEIPLPSIVQMIQTLNNVATMWGIFPHCSVNCIAVNTSNLDEGAAKSSLDLIRSQTNLPCTDPVRFGAGELVEALVNASALNNK